MNTRGYKVLARDRFKIVKNRQFTIDRFVTEHLRIGARRRVSTELNESERVFGPSSAIHPLI